MKYLISIAIGVSLALMLLVWALVFIVSGID